MIPRYSNPEMTTIWSDENRYKIWLKIEQLALDSMAKAGLAPKEAAEAYRNKGAFSVKRIEEIEREVKHDVIAFLTNVAESVGPLSRYAHRGMTSSDVLDTCLGVQLAQSGALLQKRLKDALAIVLKRAQEFKHTPCIGRSHGIHAEPTTFGLKLLGWWAELKRQEKRLEAAVCDVSAGKISGAVGTFAGISPAVEQHVMKELSLTAESVATQVVSRERHANFLSVLAGIASSIERAAVEVRHLQRSEVREAQEGFSKGQKGSSAMPHKRNPILSENLSGLARLMRGYAQVGLENVALWHERDISHSSAERVVMPDGCTVMDFMLTRFASLISQLDVFPERMLFNLEQSRGTVFSGHLLLALVDAGMTREDAYKKVQQHSLAAWDGGATLLERTLDDGEISSKIGESELKKIFDVANYLKNVDYIFDRTLKEFA